MKALCMCNGVAEQKLDPDLKKKKKNGNFRSDLAIFEKKSLPNRCGMESDAIHAQS